MRIDDAFDDEYEAQMNEVEVRAKDYEEAFALCFARLWNECADGESFSIHTEDCELDEEHDCSCTPQTFKKGAKA